VKSGDSSQPSDKPESKLGKNYWKLWSATAISNLGDGVSIVAYPWLASAVTRSPMLIALAAMMGRLPWLLFTLPAGVITDRYDRKKIIIAMDIFRSLLTLTVATILLFFGASLPDLDSLTEVKELATNWPLYAMILISALLFGTAEVLRDNASQSFLPAVVDKANFERANGRLYSAEFVMNSFIGPPLGTLLIGIGIYLPFYFDATTFFIGAVLIWAIATIRQERPPSDQRVEQKGKINFITEIKEGLAWLWQHRLLRSMAIILGLLNFVGAIATTLFILFAQEILSTSVLVFAILVSSGAVGGIIGGVLAPKISQRLGSGRALALSLFMIPLTVLVVGLSSHWSIVWVMTALSTIMAVLWNVITVSLRQSIIPTFILGRVNSVYRFFAWGSIPLGMAFAGGLVLLFSELFSREWALRSPYLVAAAGGFLLFLYGRSHLTTAKIDAARRAAES
jgi:MFS family permease